MNMQRDTAKPDIFSQAEYWLVRLHAENCSPQERMAFRQWRTEPACAEAYAATEALWNDIGNVETHPEIRELSEEVLLETEPQRTTDHQPRTTQPFWRRPMALAASVAAIAVALGSALLLYDPNAHTTGLGEQQTVALADGSTVILNTETRVEVDFTETVRSLRLVRGEALFDVGKDPQRPFQVTAGDSRVVALGTRFQVRRDADRVKVTLLEGQVEIQKAKAPDEHTAPYALRLAPDIFLEAGEQITIAKAQNEIVREKIEDKEAVVSWTNGRLVFRATPLEEAVAEVNRYARTKLRIADPALAGLPISGTFVTGDSEILAAALETNFPIQAEQTGRREIALRRQPSVN
jgi:transmembrane sensor